MQIFVLSLMAVLLVTRCASAESFIRQEWQVGDSGTAVAFADLDASPKSVLIHFHGAEATVLKAFRKSELNAILVVVNFPGLSSAYSKPFSQDQHLFEGILKQVKTKFGIDDNSRQNLWISSFSAGYGAVRELLKSGTYFDQIDAMVAADSIYAGLEATEPERVVDGENMSGFLRFADLASQGKKTFVISHSALETSYASTVETAGYLLQELKIPRTKASTYQLGENSQTTRGGKGRFLVLGFAGKTGEDHMQHLRSIDVFWKLLPLKGSNLRTSK